MFFEPTFKLGGNLYKIEIQASLEEVGSLAVQGLYTCMATPEQS